MGTACLLALAWAGAALSPLVILCECGEAQQGLVHVAAVVRPTVGQACEHGQGLGLGVCAVCDDGHSGHVKSSFAVSALPLRVDAALPEPRANGLLAVVVDADVALRGSGAAEDREPDMLAVVRCARLVI